MFQKRYMILAGKGMSKVVFLFCGDYIKRAIMKVIIREKLPIYKKASAHRKTEIITSIVKITTLGNILDLKSNKY